MTLTGNLVLYLTDASSDYYLTVNFSYFFFNSTNYTAIIMVNCVTESLPNWLVRILYIIQDWLTSEKNKRNILHRDNVWIE